MFSKKKIKELEKKESTVCQYCGLNCYNQSSLERHLEWAHKEQKVTVKS
jgi:hypothetical protein